MAIDSDKAAGQNGDRDSAEPGVTLEDIRAYLSGLASAELVEMIIEQARKDDGLHQRLLLRTAKGEGGKPDLATWRQAIDDAVGEGQFISYQESGGYAQQIDDVVDAIAALLKDGHADAAIELAEYGIEEIGGVLDEIDDSDGEVQGVMLRLQELHRTACREAPPDPEALAERLFDLEMADEWGVFGGGVADYAEALGERGLALYRKRAEAEWAKVPPLAPGDTDANRYGRRFRITVIMQNLARLAGDVEAMVAVKSRDLSMPYGFLEIATLYREAGDADRALAWAERGWAAFAEAPYPDDRLRQFLADAYHDRGRHEDAMSLAWQAFSKLPNFTSYGDLKRHADRAGAWAAWREKALARIHECLADARRPQGRAPGTFFRGQEESGHSILVEIFLWEGDGEAAWREAKTAGCSPRLWLELAESRAATHPLDAVAIYQEHIGQLLATTDNRLYHQAVEYARKARDLLIPLGQAQAFADYVQELRLAHRRKRNFLKLLDQAGW